MATATPADPAGTWTLDPIHSTPASPSSTWSSRPSAAASRTSTRRSPSTRTARSLDGTVDVGSIVVKDENLAAHLQSPDFFDTERYPELRFDSSDSAATATSSSSTAS